MNGRQSKCKLMGVAAVPIIWIPRNSPGQNPGVGSLSLLQGIFPTQGSNQDPLHCRQILYQLSYPSSGVLPTKPQDVALLPVPSDLSAITKSHVPLPSKLSLSSASEKSAPAPLSNERYHWLIFPFIPLSPYTGDGDGRTLYAILNTLV